MLNKRTTKKITIRFSKRLKSEMLQALVKSGYGLRDKSKWLSEAIELFIKQPNFVDFVEQGIDINQAELSEIEAFYLDSNSIEQIKQASIDVRKTHPLFEGVQSSIIRAAVIYRLMLGK